MNPHPCPSNVELCFPPETTTCGKYRKGKGQLVDVNLLHSDGFLHLEKWYKCNECGHLWTESDGLKIKLQTSDETAEVEE